MTASRQRLIDALDAWMSATNAYSECERGLPATPLARATEALVHAIHTLAGSYTPRRVTTLQWSHTKLAVIAEIQAVALRFIGDQYGDDDTDSPCDVEWDVHGLIRRVDPSHVIPDDVEPAHVAGPIFPHPSDDD